MARDQGIKETNIIPGGILVDADNQLVGFTSRGKDIYLPTFEKNSAGEMVAKSGVNSPNVATVKTNDVTGGIDKIVAGSKTVNRAVMGDARRTSNLSHNGMGTLSAFTSAAKAATMWQESMMLPCGVDSIQIGILSDVADVSTYTGIEVWAQTSDKTGAGSDLKNPYFASAVQTMQRVTFGGANNPTFIAGTAQLPKVIWSDWIPVVNTGGGDPSYLIVRSWYPGTVAAGGGYAGVNQVGGRVVTLQSLGADGFYGYVGTNQGSNNAATLFSSSATLPVLVRFSARKRVTSIAQYGDSTRQGYYGAGVVSALERYAIAKNITNKPTSVANRGITGQTTDQFLARLLADCANGERFDVLVYQVASPNDGYSAAISQKQIANAHEAIRTAEKMGAHIILDGPFPMTAGTLSANQQTVINNARAFCVAMDGIRPGVSSCLYDSLHDTSYGKWIAAYNYSGDGLHQNELGTTAVILPQLTLSLDAVF